MVELLNGRYELGDPLGAGGMGRVYRAHDQRLDRAVAVKVLRGDLVEDETARARLSAEARIAGQLQHPGIASVFDHDEDVASANRDPFIVMQLVEGTSLSTWLREQGPLRVDQVERILTVAADALAAAHHLGVVHRDVKPANVVLKADGSPVLVDFGIAASPGREALTETGSILGTAEYLSPEQARGQAATPASDVYSLGLVAYQSLTGSSPFRRDTSVAAALATVAEPLPELPDHVPANLRRVVAEMTAKDPDRRPSAAAVAEAMGVTSPPEPATAPLTIDAHPHPRARRRAGALLGSVRRRSRLMSSAAVVVAGAVAYAVFGLPGGGPAVVPDVVGLSVDAATAKLADAGFETRQEPVDSPTAAAGTVTEQDPRVGGVASGVVTLSVSTGRMDAPAADLVGQSVDEVRAWLEERGFAVTTKSATSDEPAGTVIDLDRSGSLPVGTSIALSVSSGPAVAPTEPAQTDPAQADEPKGKGGSGKAKGKDNGKGPGAKG